jgi:hypothetical protein
LWRKAWPTRPAISTPEGAGIALTATSYNVATAWSLRLAGAGIVAMSAWTVAMAVWTPLQAAWCA